VLRNAASTQRARPVAQMLLERRPRLLEPAGRDEIAVAAPLDNRSIPGHTLGPAAPAAVVGKVAHRTLKTRPLGA